MEHCRKLYICRYFGIKLRKLSYCYLIETAVLQAPKKQEDAVTNFIKMVFVGKISYSALSHNLN